MAKAKKSDETKDAAAETPAAPKKTPAKKKAPGAASASQATAAPAAAASAAKKPAAKKPAASPAGFGFGIDTNLAAQAAAKMLLNRPSTSAPSTGGTGKGLKDTLGKPATPNLGNLLGGGPAGSNKSSNLPHFGGQQKGHNQATGHLGNTGVPRRTPG